MRVTEAFQTLPNFLLLLVLVAVVRLDHHHRDGGDRHRLLAGGRLG